MEAEKNIKIMLVHFNSELSGSDLSLFYHVKWLNKEQFTPVVVLPFKGPLSEKYKRLGIKVIYSSITKLQRKTAALILYLLRFPFELFSLVKIIKEENPRIVHTNDLPNLHGPIAARMCGKKHVQHIRKYELRPRIIYDILAFIAIALSNIVIAVSEANINNLPIITRIFRNIICIHNGVDMEIFNRELYLNSREKLNISRQVRVIGNISNFGYLKGQGQILDIAPSLLSKFKNLLFVFMGDKSKEGFFEIERAITEKGIRDEVVVFDNTYYVPEVLSLIDIFVFPSLRESFPRSIIEAMAMGRAIICSDVGGVREAIEDGENGFIVKVNDSEELEGAIVRLLEDSKLMNQLGEKAYIDCKRYFDVEQITKRIESIYSDVLKG